MSKKSKDSGNVRLAEDILRGRATTARDALELARKLKAEKQFGYARRLLARARVEPDANEDAKLSTLLRQQHALCTYKDVDLSSGIRFDRAIDILGGGGDLQATTDQETLGLAGAIYKYKWIAFAQSQDLEVSLNYYRRGAAQGFGDRGFTAINQAYVLDLLADQEWMLAEHIGISSASARQRMDEAKEVRRGIIRDGRALMADPETEKKLKSDWFFLVTLAEAHFGLEQYEEARPYLLDAAAIENVNEWEYETTARQLASLARLLLRRDGKESELVDSKPWCVLKEFLGERGPGVSTAFLGKVGLALSGGGFRASLFHIGVLAKLAELDILRHVEVLSCVSGGSILGAHYYLKVRRLLETTESKDITREHYIQIVHELQNEFLSGVQKNIRTRVIGSVLANLRMAFQSDYSRIERVGELYEKFLYKQVDGKTEEFWLNELFVQPKGEEAPFRPKSHNWRRSAKVPILVLNATTLNTGHNWQFTASWMGEPPAGSDSAIDANYRLRRMYYSEAPEYYHRVRLGHAVAASACVPGLFDPLTFSGLYPEISVRLVDGGVHDNQGTSALLEQDCNVLLVSDASGQMGQEDMPPDDFIRVPLRSNSILQSRIRVAQYLDLAARKRSSMLKGFMFVHLKQDLDADAKDWVNCEDPIAASDDARPAHRQGELTCYGIRKDIQRKLASIRTDLDSFHDAEASALMVSGYRMTEYAFPRNIKGFPEVKPAPPTWRFLKIEGLMQRRGGAEQLFDNFARLLDVGKLGPFKIWQLEPPLRIVGKIIPVVAVLTILAVCYQMRNVPLTTFPYHYVGITLASVIGSVLLGRLFGPQISKMLTSYGTRKRIQSEVWRMVVYVALAVIGFFLAWIHLLIFDRWYLRRGGLERVTGEPAPPLKTPQ